MIEQDIQEELRNRFMGEIETEIVEMQHCKARIYPGEQVNLERKSEHTDDIWVENGLFEPVGYYYSAKLILPCLGRLAKLASCPVKEAQAWMPGRFADCSRCLPIF